MFHKSTKIKEQTKKKYEGWKQWINGVVTEFAEALFWSSIDASNTSRASVYDLTRSVYRIVKQWKRTKQQYQPDEDCRENARLM